MAKSRGRHKVIRGRDSQGQKQGRDHGQGRSYLVGDNSSTDAQSAHNSNHADMHGASREAKSKKTCTGKKNPSGFSVRAFSAVIISVLVPLVSVIVVLFHMCHQRGQEFIRELEAVESHQRVSLFEPYSLDFEALMDLRAENMQKYDYQYDKFGIDRRSGLSLQEYKDVYDAKWPVIITDVIPTWKAGNWTSEFFVEKYGKERVTMKAVDNTLENAVTLALPLELFYKNTHKAYPSQWTYVEDELFIPMRPELKRDIGECIYLEEDFYQLFPEEVRPWNAMLLWGTKHSRSSLHMDPYNWTGTNAVLKGRKRWKMFIPGQDHKLYVKGNRKSGFPLNCFKYNSPIDAIEPDLHRFPAYKDIHYLEFEQLPGELLIIPTGWYHQAYNVEETIAVSSQVMNSNNFRVVLEEVLKADNLPRHRLPLDVDSRSPAEQVKTVMSLLSPDILARGREVTSNILNQIREGHRKTGYEVPFQ